MGHLAYGTFLVSSWRTGAFKFRGIKDHSDIIKLSSDFYKFLLTEIIRGTNCVPKDSMCAS